MTITINVTGDITKRVTGSEIPITEQDVIGILTSPELEDLATHIGSIT